MSWGATSTTSNSLYDNGFGAGPANSQQCVISYLWPIETEPVLLFGVIFAHYFSCKNNFCDAFKMTVRLLNQDNEIISQTLHPDHENLDLSEMQARLQKEINSNIYYWGSGVYSN